MVYGISENKARVKRKCWVDGKRCSNQFSISHFGTSKQILNVSMLWEKKLMFVQNNLQTKKVVKGSKVLKSKLLG